MLHLVCWLVVITQLSPLSSMMTSISILSSSGLLTSPKTGELEAELAGDYGIYDCYELTK